MIRVILGISKRKHTNMQHIREKLKMMSVNQMAVYHTLLEAFNVIRNSSSELIQSKWIQTQTENYTLRSISKNDLKIPEKPKTRCIGFTYSGAKLFNSLPSNVKEAKNVNVFKNLIKDFIWEKIPSY